MVTAYPIVDAHLHSWDRSAIRYPWLEGDDQAPERFVPSDLGVAERPSAAVFIEVDAAPEDAVREAEWAAALPDGTIAAVVAFAPIDHGDAVRPALERLRRLPKVVGIRRLLQDAPDALLTDPTTAQGLRAVGDHGFIFDACVRYHQLPALLSLVRAAPGTTVVLDHLGKPPVRDGWGSASAIRWHQGLRSLAAEPNTVVKLSGLAPESAPGGLEAQVRPFVEAALEAFGVTRAMAGSDWPVSRVPGRTERYGDWFALLATGFGLDDGEQAQVLGATAARVYALPKGSASRP